MIKIQNLTGSLVTLAMAVSTCFSAVALAQTASTPPGAAALLAKSTELKGRLADNQFRRPLVLESSEGDNIVDGSVYAVLDSPFVAVSRTLKSPERWCDVMMLHINTKYCRAAADEAPTQLKVSIGRKTHQQLSDAFALDFNFQLLASSADYFSVILSAGKGPLGTSNYRIELQAVPLPENRTFMRLRYAYGYGVASRVAMQGYLATIGSGKVGFTQQNADGQKPGYIGGMRGAAERNIMRYYLAIEAYQATLSRPVAERLDARLEKWFAATEEYPRQLREVDKDGYLAMKKLEHQRLQSASLAN